jgi:hypothetical protein
MARAKSTETEAEPATETEGVVQIISTRKLKKLLKECRIAADDAHEINSSIGGKISDAAKNDYLHKKAFADLRKADKMTPEKLNDWWTTLKHYMRESGLEERASSAPRLSLEDNVEHLDEHREGAAEAAE